MCVSSWNRSWCASTTDHGGFLRAADHGGNRGGDSAGDKVVDMLVIAQRQVLGETEQKTVEVPQLQLSRGRPFLGQGCRHARSCATSGAWSRLSENHRDSTVVQQVQFFSKSIVCPGSSGQVCQPSITKSSW